MNKRIFKAILFFVVGTLAFFGCDSNDGGITNPEGPGEVNTSVNFQYRSTINVGGETASEISAYDPATQKLFVVNVEMTQISVYSLSDIDNPAEETAISMSEYGVPNSVAIHDSTLAVAVESEVKQNPGSVLLYDTADQSLVSQFEVGSLPDMVTFTNDGSTILSANEGEPNDGYTVDPKGSVSIIDRENNEVVTLDFAAFNGQEAALKEQGFRVFGPNATLAQDVEPEYIATSDDGQTAWVSLQENNGIAKIDLVSKTIEDIFPLGFKDYSLEENALDASDQDDVKELKNWPVYGVYQPDALTSATINGTDYVFSANEGDARDYDAFGEEERVEDVTLDPSVFPEEENYQTDTTLGRLEVTTALGDADEDGQYEALYSYGARSFSVWSGSDGSLIYDSGNSIGDQTLTKTPQRFNDDDSRSDAKGGEPEAVELLNMGNERYILFVGLERNDQVLLYDVTNPAAPEFLSILSHDGDEAPEGLLVVPAADSPSESDLLIVSNEDSGTVSIYENEQ